MALLTQLIVPLVSFAPAALAPVASAEETVAEEPATAGEEPAAEETTETGPDSTTTDATEAAPAEEPAADAGGTIAAAFETLAETTRVVEEVRNLADRLDDPPDRTLLLTVEVDSLPFPLGPILAGERTYVAPLEWAGTMPEMNWVTTTRRVRWSLIDPDTGRRDHAIGWRFRRGDLVKVRLVSDRNAFHAMHHPIHVHGQRFLVAAVNGVAPRNRAWKDTVIVPGGGAVDLLIEMSNPGAWMLHCHTAEHLEAGMHTAFTVEEDEP